MKIYFAGSIRGGRELQPIYQEIITGMKKAGHEILSEHIGSIDVNMFGEGKLSDKSIYERDILWISDCDIVIADVSTPSLGVGYEIAYALHVEHKPVLCIYNNNNLSAMIKGNNNPSIKIDLYETAEKALEIISNFIADQP